MFNTKVLATKAQITLVIPRVLSLKGEDKDGTHAVVRELATISVCSIYEIKKRFNQFNFLKDDTDLTFGFDWNESYRAKIAEYVLKMYDDDRPPAPEYLNGNLLKHQNTKSTMINYYYYITVPIQVQLQYNDLTGNQMLQTTTVSLKAHWTRTDAEDEIDSAVVSLRAIHESARMAQNGIVFSFFFLSFFFLFFIFLFSFSSSYSNLQKR